MKLKEKVAATIQWVKGRIKTATGDVKEVEELVLDTGSKISEVEGDREAFTKECVESDAKFAVAFEQSQQAAYKVHI